MRRAVISTATAIALAVFMSCHRPQRAPDLKADLPAARGHAAGATHLHNVIPVTEKVISGAVPEGDAAFEELRAMGVRTIISVDGAAPNVERARAHGLRYVHLPIGYDGIDPVRQLELARAIHDLPGLIYVHCHHGKHRGPAAAAVAAVLLGELNTEQAIAFMQKAGTAETYRGLYECVREASPVPADVLDGVAAEFPEVAPRPTFIKVMVAAQEAYDHLVEIRDAGWRVPPHHPDLVPLMEAARLEGLMRGALDDPEVSKHPEDFAHRLTEALHRIQEFEAALKAGAPNSELTSRLGKVRGSCKACHVRYRDNR